VNNASTGKNLAKTGYELYEKKVRRATKFMGCGLRGVSTAGTHLPFMRVLRIKTRLIFTRAFNKAQIYFHFL
jgi:hypothetical protein